MINLPAGGTPIDFAYSIHSAVGNHMVAAKVNGHIAQFDSKLKNGDVVEIVTSKSAHGPSRDWMKIARSSEARVRYASGSSGSVGTRTSSGVGPPLSRRVKRTGVTLKELTAEENLPNILKRLAYKSLDDMYAAIGYGGVTSLKLIGRLREEIQRILKMHQEERAAEEPLKDEPGKPAPPSPSARRASRASWSRGCRTAWSNSPSAARLSPATRSSALLPGLWRVRPPEGLPQC